MRKWNSSLRNFCGGDLEDSESRKEMEFIVSAARLAANADRKGTRNTHARGRISADQQLTEGVTRIELILENQYQPSCGPATTTRRKRKGS